MKRRIECFANLVFYHLFRFDKLGQRIFGVPIRWIVRLPAVGQNFKRRGVENAEEEINKALYDPRRGFNIIHAGWYLTGLFWLIFFGTAVFLIPVFWKNFEPFEDVNIYFWLFMLMTFAPALTASEILAEHKKKYLKYFKKFEQKSEQWHSRTAWLSFFIVFGIWVYAIGGLLFYLNHIK